MGDIPIEGFEKWLLTGRGKKCLDINSLTDVEFLKNRLWWAYHAGMQSDDIKLVSPVQEIFDDLANLNGRYLPKNIKQRIEYILKNKKDYTRL